MDRKTAKEKIKDAILEAIWTTGHRGYQQSQRDCPVVTGELKRSGSDTSQEDGIVINYSAEYASFIEQGIQAGTRHVKAHTQNGHPVKSYSYEAKAVKATPFIEKSLTKAFDSFSDDINANLQDKFGGKITKE